MHPLPGSRAGVGIVWSKHHVIHLQKGLLLEAVQFKHIQSCATDLSRIAVPELDADSSTIGPRAVLIRIATGFIWLKDRLNSSGDSWLGSDHSAGSQNLSSEVDLQARS